MFDRHGGGELRMASVPVPHMGTGPAGGRSLSPHLQKDGHVHRGSSATAGVVYPVANGHRSVVVGVFPVEWDGQIVFHAPVGVNVGAGWGSSGGGGKEEPTTSVTGEQHGRPGSLCRKAKEEEQNVQH